MDLIAPEPVPPPIELTQKQRQREEARKQRQLRDEMDSLEAFDRMRGDPLRDAVALIKHALFVQPAQEAVLDQVLAHLDQRRVQLEALEATGRTLTLLDLASVIPELAAILNPEPTSWDELTSADPLPEWCSPEWVGPWETTDGDDEA